MKTFCHIGEFGYMGWSLLPTAVLLNERISIWAPSFHQLRRAYDEDKTILEPRHLIELIERRKVQVMARPEWIFDEATRNSDPRWINSKWDNEFDTKLREMAERSPAGLDPHDSPIRIMPPERGWDWSSSLKSTGHYYKRASRRYSERKLPEGLLVKADRYARGGRDPVRCVLRDAKNHEDAFRDSGAWAPLEPSTYPEALAYIMGRQPQPANSSPVSFDTNRLWDLFRALQSITSLRSGDDLIDRIDKGKHEDFKKDLNALLLAETLPHHNQLHELIEFGARNTSWLTWPKVLLPRPNFGTAKSLSALLLMAVSAALAPPELSVPTAVVTVLSVVHWALDPLGRVPRALSLRRVDEKDYDGPRLPFFLASGVTKPTIAEIRFLLDKLERFSANNR